MNKKLMASFKNKTVTVNCGESVFVGSLMDMDKDYIYLGEDTKVQLAIKSTSVDMILLGNHVTKTEEVGTLQ